MDKLIKEAITDLEKKFGSGVVMRYGDEPELELEVIPSGCLGIDAAIGAGGFPKGRIVEVFGPESSGKTTLCLEVAANAQKNGDLVAFVDVEHALNPNYARKLGVNMDEVFLSQPSGGEEALDIVDRLMKTGKFGMIIVDSVAALVTRAEVDGNFGDAHMGGQARLMGQALRKLNPLAAKHNVCLVFINQLRSKIGVFFGSPEVTTGGNALKFYASVRVDIRKISTLKDKDEVVGGRTRVRILKNKVGLPFRECEFDLIYGEGIDKVGNVLDLAEKYGLVVKKGSWYSDGENNFAQGKVKAVEYLKENEAYYTELYAKVSEKIKEFLSE